MTQENRGIERIANLDELKPIISTFAWNKLTNIIDGTITGSDKIVLTPVGKRLDQGDGILTTWNKFFESLDKSSWPEELIDMEERQISKIGPRSIAKPWEQRKQSIYEYYEPSTAKKDCEPGDSPVKTRDLNRLRPVSNETALKKIKKSTAASLPTMESKGKALEDMPLPMDKNGGYKWSQSSNKLPLESGKVATLQWPAVLYTRTQEQGKTRGVWGISLDQILSEIKFFLPVLDWMKRQPWLAALLGPEEVNDRMDTIIRSAISRDELIVSTDFSSFDASTKGAISDCAWNDYITLFQERYHPYLLNVKYDFNEVPLATPDGILYGYHGTPSGSMNTTPIGSLAHANLMKSYGTIELDESLILIDDGCLVLKDRDDVKKYLDHCESWGYKTNADKTFVSGICAIFLQHLYHPALSVDGKIKGVYPISRAFGRLCYLERFVTFVKDGLKGEEYFAIRSLSILECTKYHPSFEQFVKFWLSLDKYPLLPSSDSVVKYIRRLEQTEGTEGIIKNQYGDDLHGIQSWKSYQLIKELDGSS